MSLRSMKALEHTPKIDCGLCGMGSCAGFLRAMSVSLKETSACPILQLPDFSEKKSELERLSSLIKPGAHRPAPNLPEGGVLMTRPCKDTDERVMAELRIFNGVNPGDPMDFRSFDPFLFCHLLDFLSHKFQTIKCSKDLGYGRADTGEMSITLLNDGRINMRRVISREQVLQLFSVLEKTLLGSVVCNCCGADLLSILSGFVKPLREDVHTVLHAGVTLQLDNAFAINHVTLKEFLRAYGDDGRPIVDEIEQLFQQIIWEIERMIAGQPRCDMEFPDVSRLLGSVINLLIDDSSSESTTIGLKTLALVHAVDGAISALRSIVELCQECNHEIELEILDLIANVRDGDLTQNIPSIEFPKVLVAYSHMYRVNQAIKLLYAWNQ